MARPCDQNNFDNNKLVTFRHRDKKIVGRVCNVKSKLFVYMKYENFLAITVRFISIDSHICYNTFLQNKKSLKFTI